HSMEDVARIADRLIVFDGGHIAMDGTPKAVFSRADELRAIGLDVPAVTEIAARLLELGIPVPKSCYTVDALYDALLSIKGGQTPC
ncbi:MAG: energy-coupling factor transporter ATPase, partial [Oscillospiraceae bacterium]